MAWQAPFLYEDTTQMMLVLGPSAPRWLERIGPVSRRVRGTGFMFCPLEVECCPEGRGHSIAHMCVSCVCVFIAGVRNMVTNRRGRRCNEQQSIGLCPRTVRLPSAPMLLLMILVVAGAEGVSWTGETGDSIHGQLIYRTYIIDESDTGQT